MMSKNLINKISAVISAVVILVIGILCIIANNAQEGNDAATAFEGISLTLGIVFIVVSVLALALEITLIVLAKGGALLKASAIASGVLLALGIFFCANKTSAGTLLAMFLNFVPYVMVVIGGLLVLDAILTLVFGLMAKKETKAVVIVFVIKLVIGALAILLGALAMGDNWLGNNKFTIFGIILIIYAVFTAVAAFLAPKFTVVAIVKTNDNEEKAAE